ncbi:dATP/dGTP diphosphohydrolase domain-containing protein [Methylomonas sp. MED-D]|uniref:dATP/dGTP diphosphohydrolase domain-containing protein n=1 Tax=Methylomonas sp. MED-D TaxID=3418768 RepID=UPI003D02D1FD
MAGKKFDAGKPDYTLVPWSGVTKVVEVLMFGASKYSAGGWQFVPDGERRYLAAALRHLSAYADGEQCDQESGLSHLAHAACCLLFLLAD